MKKLKELSPEQRARVKYLRARKKELRNEMTAYLVKRQMDSFVKKYGLPWTPNWCVDNAHRYGQ